MAADPLQQLRDIHPPEPPGLWPPAPGWWLLAALALTAVAVLAVLAWRARRRRRPLRYARRLHQAAYRRYRQGVIGSREYLDESNELLKRVLIHGLGEREARRASGERWLALLDRHLDNPEFTQGPGRALGNQRFRPDPVTDVEGVHASVERLLERLSPPRRAP